MASGCPCAPSTQLVADLDTSIGLDDLSPHVLRHSFATDMLGAGGTLQAHNRGGEDHTSTEVANVGGGCIAALNDLLGLTPVPECAGFPGGAFATTLVQPGDTVTTTPLPPRSSR
jgi:hypothetical protein